MIYTLVSVVQVDHAIQDGLSDGLRMLKEKVNDYIFKGWEPIGGIAIHDTYRRGKAVIEFVQATINRE